MNKDPAGGIRLSPKPEQLFRRILADPLAPIIHRAAKPKDYILDGAHPFLDEYHRVNEALLDLIPGPNRRANSKSRAPAYKKRDKSTLNDLPWQFPGEG